MTVRKRLILFVFAAAMGAVLVSEAVAAGPPNFVAPQSVADDVVKKRDAGWKLTELGKLVAARVPVKLKGAQGMVLLATTDDPALASANGGAESAGAPAAAPARATPTIQKKQSAQCIDKNKRRLVMTAGAGFVCTWGQRANAQWTSQHGGAYSQFTLQDLNWSYYPAPPLYGYCQQLGCFWHSFHVPPPDVRVTFIVVENAQFARIDNTWCG